MLCSALLCSAMLHTVRPNVHIDIFLKTFVRPVFAPKEHEFGRLGFGSPNVAKFALKAGQRHCLGEAIAGKELD